MFPNLRPRIAALFTVLLFWQAGLAPLAHAAVFHSSPGVVAAEVEAAPCHGEAAESVPVVSHEHAGHGMAMSEEAETPAAAPDCCESLACQCACVHASLGGAGLAVVLPLIPDHPAILGGEVPALAARIAELFRPPI